MPRTLLVVASAILFGLISISAQADWGFTRWSMTADQVVAASAGKVQRLSGQQVRAESTFTGSRCLLQMPGPYDAGGVIFMKVDFCFDATGRLSAVDLHTDGSKFYELDRALRSAFGAPVSASNGNLPERIFNDHRKGNTLRLIRISSTILQYTPAAKGF